MVINKKQLENIVSLIEEALRKQREESEKAQSGPTPHPTSRLSLEPTPPPPNAEAAQAPASAEAAPDGPIAEEPTRRPWGILAGIAVAGLASILFIVWLLVYGLGLWRNPPDTRHVKAAGATPAAVMPNQPARGTNDPAKLPAPPLPAAIAPAASTPISNPPPASVPSPVEQTAKSQPSPPGAQTAHPPTTPVAENVQPIQKTSPPPASIPKLEMPVLWPKLTVSGIIGSAKSGRSAAIINGQMLSPGDTIEGVTIESIEKQKVKLQFSGEIKTLSMGGSTE